ncbi:ATP synthase subunit I [Kangiella taiwanensis]|uniref:ATP synthase subunit I n=1 Tax=Kangiella taiwanensis TaxID=1079179 RepID=A0ABP8HWT0_9GAMM|nr:ATP synthase subunit I [Kangiella taiwanensis]
MSQLLAKKGRKQAYKMVLVQLAISFILFLVGLFISGTVSLSLGVGSLIVVLVNFVFATIVFRKSGAQAALQIKRAFAIGESVKLMLTIVLLVLAFNVLPVHAGSLLIGFVVIVLSQWFAPLIIK